MRGFTLIELMIVVIIMITLFGVGVASFQTAATRRVLENEGLRLVSELKKIQTSSFSGTKPASGCTTLFGHEINLDTINNAYSTRPECDTPQSWGASYQLPTTISLKTNPLLPSTTYMRFKVLSQGVENPLKICLDDSTQNKRYVITVTTSGQILTDGLQSAGTTC